MRRLFFRCPYGHFFCADTSGGCCPFDAWTYEHVALAQTMFSQNPNMQIEDFASAGIDGDLINRLMIIESLAFPTSIEAISPKCYVVDGKLEEDVARDW